MSKPSPTKFNPDEAMLEITKRFRESLFLGIPSLYLSCVCNFQLLLSILMYVDCITSIVFARRD